MTRIAALSLLLTTACASQVEAVRSAVDEAPDWFKDRRQEIGGADYPELTRMEPLSQAKAPKIGAATDETTLAALIADFFRNERAAPVDRTPEEIRAWASRMRAVFAGIEPPRPEEFITVSQDAFALPRADLASTRRK